MKYVLISPVKNEERFIEKTVQAVVSQTLLPETWVIVDDGSTDRTPEIIDRYAEKYSWIETVHRPPTRDRSFAGKVYAVNAGLERVNDLEFEVMGNLDGDVSFDPDYMEFLMDKFASDESLGVAGTPFTQEGGYDSVKDSFEGDNYVAGPCQLFRYKCFREIGGYVPNPAGGVDWIAVMTARMKGWSVRAFPEKRFHHFRSMGTAERGDNAAMFSYGEKDYYLGGSVLWQLFRAAYRCTKKPYVTGGLSLLFGYFWAFVSRTPRAVTPELMKFHRREQMTKLRAIFASLIRFQKVDAFTLSSEKKEH